MTHPLLHKRQKSNTWLHCEAWVNRLNRTADSAFFFLLPWQIEHTSPEEEPGIKAFESRLKTRGFFSVTRVNGSQLEAVHAILI